MTDYLKIELIGQDGSQWNLSGPGSGRQGVTLSPKLDQFYDAPVKTLSVPGPFGEEYAGKRVQRREIVLTVQPYDDDPDTWATIDSRWRRAWDYDNLATLKATTADGTRTLTVRLMEEPKPYYDKDPFITGDNPVVMTLASGFPYWVAEDIEIPFSTLQVNDFYQFSVHNDSDIPWWFRWTFTAPGLWIVPDFSWGNDMYSRGREDLGRTIALPELVPGEHVSADSDPRVQTLVAVNGMPTQQRWKGNDLLYPFMPGKSGTIPLRLKNASQGGAAKLTIPRWYSRPFSRPVDQL